MATSDATYTTIYKYVNYMNVILDKIDDAEGNAHEKEVIIAEAHIMRAYLHWLGANIYAKQYDEATAETEGGIPYVTDIDVSQQKEKQTLQTVYDFLHPRRKIVGLCRAGKGADANETI